MTQKKHVFLGAAALVLLVALFAGIYFIGRPAPEQGGKTITVEVVHKDERRVTFTYTTDGEYLGEVLLEEGLIRGEQSTYGMFITEVDGEQAVYETDGYYWALFEGESYATTGVDQTLVRDGGVYGLVCTKG